MTSTLTVVGDLLDRPVIAYTPDGSCAVVRMTIRCQPDLRMFGSERTADPVDYPVKAVGELAQHAHDSLRAGDRVIVVGSQCPETTRHAHTRAKQTTIWLYAHEIGAGLSYAPTQVLRTVMDLEQVAAIRARAVPQLARVA